MTCIIGVVSIQEEKQKVYIGSDSASVAGFHSTKRNDQKIFTKFDVNEEVEYIFGGSGSFRMIQLLHYTLKIPKNSRDSLFEFMCTDFIDEVRKVFKDNGYSTITANNERCDQFLVGVQGKLFMIDGDFQVNDCDLNSIGAGKDYALAAYKAFEENNNLSIEERLHKSLAISSYFCIGVKPPFIIKSIWKLEK
jgi:ATP-dependent protease HslVU (ClpYQ) peptidase subunit